MGSDRPDPANPKRETGDERRRRADALRALAEKREIETGAAPANGVTDASPLRGALRDWRQRPLMVWGSVTIIGVIIVAVVAVILWRGGASVGKTSATGPRSVIQFPFNQIACPESESWSPDGKTLAVAGYLECGAQGATETGTNPAVALFNTTSGHIVRSFSLQSVIGRVIPPGAQLGDIGEPTWSSNGSLIGVPFFYSTDAHQGAYGLVALGVNGSTQVIAPATSPAKAGVTYDHYSIEYIVPPLTVRFDLSTGSAASVTLPPAYAYTWKGPSALTPVSLSGQSGVSSGTMPSSVNGYLTYLCSTSAGASYLLTAGAGAWSPDDHYFYSTLGAYGVVSGAQPAGTSGTSTGKAPTCAKTQNPTGWQSLAAPLKGLQGAERDFQQIGSGNSLMIATAPNSSQIAVVESDSTDQGTTTTIRIYDGATGARQAQLSLQQIISANHIHQQSPGSETLQQVAWSPDGRSLALLDNQDLAIIFVRLG